MYIVITNFSASMACMPLSALMYGSDQNDFKIHNEVCKPISNLLEKLVSGVSLLGKRLLTWALGDILHGGRVHC